MKLVTTLCIALMLFVVPGCGSNNSSTGDSHTWDLKVDGVATGHTIETHTGTPTTQGTWVRKDEDGNIVDQGTWIENRLVDPKTITFESNSAGAGTYGQGNSNQTTDDSMTVAVTAPSNQTWLLEHKD